MLRIGVLGAANIARQFIAGVKGSDSVEVAAVASRDQAKAQAFADATGVARVLPSYEALLADPGIDAVYNPLPNSLHAPWSIRAAKAGKHVLCEKPLALGEAEAHSMFAAADRAGVVLREAYPYMAQPQNVTLRRLLSERAIGAITYVQASIGFTIPQGGYNVRFERELGGGAVLDAGSYPVSFVREVVGERPARVSAVARWLSPGVDLTLGATLEFPGGAFAQVACSMAVGNHRDGLIAGADGVLECTFLNHDRNGPPLLQLRRGKTQVPPEIIDPGAADGFRLEAEQFARLVNGDTTAWTGASVQESLDIAATIAAIRESAAANGGWVGVPAR